MPEEKLPLPPGVYPKHGSWYLVRRNKWTKLCRIDEGRAALYVRLQETTGGMEGTVGHAILEYRKAGMMHLSAATQKAYRLTSLRMLHHFGHYRIGELQPTHCAQFLKWHRERGTPVQGNREKAFMSSAFEYALAEGWAEFNPWRGVRRNREAPARTYVEHDALVAAIDRAPPELQPLFAVGYLLGIRQTDLREAKQDQIKGDELLVTESKTRKRNAHKITPTVRRFLNQAIERSKGFESDYIFTSKRGLPWTEYGLATALTRFDAGFKFRELRAKAQTDSEKNILGHTGQLRDRYTRRRKLAAVK